MRLKRSKQIHVMIVSLSTYPLFNPECGAGFGGAEVQLYLLGTHLNNYDQFKLSYLVGDFGQDAVEDYDGITVIRSIGKKYRKPEHAESLIARNVRRFQKWGRRLLFGIRFFMQRPDIIVVRTASGGVGKMRLWCALTRTKFVYMAAHEIDTSGEFERNNGKAGKWYRYGLTKADLVIAQNREQHDQLKTNYNKDSIILNSVYDVVEVAKPNPEFVLWVGRCEDWKRPEIFIELARRNPDHQFVMVAPPALTQAAYTQSIQESCAQLSNMTYHALIPFHKINDYFLRASLFVISSRYEGFPNTLIQAAKNKTAIASLNVNPNELFTTFDIGLWSNGDEDQFYTAVSDALDNPQQLQHWGEEAYSYAKRYHDIDEIAPQYAALFSELVG